MRFVSLFAGELPQQVVLPVCQFAETSAPSPLTTSANLHARSPL